MGIKEGSEAIFVNPDQEALNNMNLPDLLISTELNDKFDYIHLFVKSQSEFIDHFPKLKAHLKPTGMLWVSCKKAENQAPT